MEKFRRRYLSSQLRNSTGWYPDHLHMIITIAACFVSFAKAGGESMRMVDLGGSALFSLYMIVGCGTTISNSYATTAR